MKLLSILIASVVERNDLLQNLLNEFERQRSLLPSPEEVEIIVIQDDKEISIGAKRQQLLECSTGNMIVFFDDDDWPKEYYISKIYFSILANTEIDCIGINVEMTTNGGRPEKCCHSLKYPLWENDVDGWNYVRNITHFNPVRRDLALQSGFKDLRFGEDKDYSDRLFPLLKREFYIEEPLFEYRYTNHQKHNEKYGIK